MNDSPRPTFVVAGDYSQFGNWCREALGCGQRTAEELGAKYVVDTYRLNGYREFDVIYYGTYHRRRDIAEIQAVVRAMGKDVTESWHEDP